MSLKETRQKLGISQQKLASRARVSLATVQNIECGKANPELETLEQLAEALGLDLILQRRPINWDALVPYGLPLFSKATNFLPHVSDLLTVLTTIPYETCDTSKREWLALVSFLRALHDHFPSVWKKTDSLTREFLEAHNKLVSPKLRRLALRRLAEYL